MKLQALTGSLDTRSVIPAISAIPQIYFVGGEDRVTPPAITENFVRIYPQGRRPALITLQNNGHTCCWAEQWANLWLQAENTLR